MKYHLLALLLLFCAGSVNSTAAECDDPPTGAGLSAICGVVAPEDVVALDERYLIVSSLAVSDHLYLLDTQSDELLPMPTGLDAPPVAERWGDPQCAPPVYMMSHGIDLSHFAGEQRLLVVNHGARESVEMFAVRTDESLPGLQWLGCVMAAENTEFNDVAALPDGGFLATDPLTASWKLARIVAGTFGMATGRVYRWDPSDGYRDVPNTEGAYPNGITLAADAKSFYLNLYLDGEVREHDVDSGEVLRRVAIKKPDNSTLTDDGRLLVASHRASVPAMVKAVASDVTARNRIAFDIVYIDLERFGARALYSDDGRSLGGATVAVAVEDVLYIGAFRGDRLLRVEMP